MEVDAVRAQLRQLVHGPDRIERRPHRLTERVTPDVADGPEAEREVMLGARHVVVVRNGTVHGTPITASQRGLRGSGGQRSCMYQSSGCAGAS